MCLDTDRGCPWRSPGSHSVVNAALSLQCLVESARNQDEPDLLLVTLAERADDLASDLEVYSRVIGTRERDRAINAARKAYQDAHEVCRSAKHLSWLLGNAYETSTTLVAKLVHPACDDELRLDVVSWMFDRTQSLGMITSLQDLDDRLGDGSAWQRMHRSFRLQCLRDQQPAETALELYRRWQQLGERHARTADALYDGWDGSGHALLDMAACLDVAA